MTKRFFSALLCFALLLAAAAPGFAVEKNGETPVPEKTLTIRSEEGFLAFAEKCRLDSYSQDLTVHLEANLNLADTGFTGVPIFCGTFLGKNHTISGLELTADGSVQGLFRYLTATAQVTDLNVQGSVQPGGSQEAVGGIAGENAGLIKNCIFKGDISGGSSVGGIAGKNTVSGIIEDCRIQGTISGSHFVGGAAGENKGVIRDTMNHAAINTTPQQNTVSLTDMTLESMVSSESAATVTDIGGIAGVSAGVIRNCVNRGDVGYQHMGYNIGGIAGTQSGYIVDCENRGDILGRKEVGGIAGQMEPAAVVEYDEDALQILKQQLSGMSSTVSKTASNVQDSGEALYGQVNSLRAHIQDARDSVEQLIPDKDDPQLPDMDAIQAAQNGLSSSISGMAGDLEGMRAATASSMGLLSNNLRTLQNQINAMSNTLNNASQTLGGSLTDVSDEDTEGDLTGKVLSCRNYGDVLGDLNIGGIAGAMAMENDLDIREDWQVLGDNSLNFESQLRAVILDCENQGTVTAGKRAAGGIAGWQSLGLIRNCRSTGSVDAPNAEYVGGIAGQSLGFLRASSANCLLSGGEYVGGIAGSASVATDCRSLVHLESGSEKLGAILGGTEDPKEDVEDPICGNYYLSVNHDIGGIDGISYDGLAQSLEAGDFFALENLPEIFGRALVTFRFENGNTTQIRVPTGGALESGQIPELPEKAGSIGVWEGLAEADTSCIYFDLSFDAVYTSLRTAIESQPDETGLPLMLVQGEFGGDTALTVTEADAPETAEGETALGAWRFALSREEPVTALRLRLPESCGGEHVQVRLEKNNQWETIEHTLDGRYVVVSLDSGAEAIALVETEPFNWYLPAVAAGALLLTVCLLIAFRRKKASGKQAEEAEAGL